jgi:hypothetical protein
MGCGNHRTCRLYEKRITRSVRTYLSGAVTASFLYPEKGSKGVLPSVREAQSGLFLGKLQFTPVNMENSVEFGMDKSVESVLWRNSDEKPKKSRIQQK